MNRSIKIGIACAGLTLGGLIGYGLHQAYQSYQQYQTQTIYWESYNKGFARGKIIRQLMEQEFNRKYSHLSIENPRFLGTLREAFIFGKVPEGIDGRVRQLHQQLTEDGRKTELFLKERIGMGTP